MDSHRKAWGNDLIDLSTGAAHRLRMAKPYHLRFSVLGRNLNRHTALNCVGHDDQSREDKARVRAFMPFHSCCARFRACVPISNTCRPCRFFQKKVRPPQKLRTVHFCVASFSGSGFLPAARKLTTLLSKSNQNGAPNDNAPAVTSRPAIFIIGVSPARSQAHSNFGEARITALALA